LRHYLNINEIFGIPCLQILNLCIILFLLSFIIHITYTETNTENLIVKAGTKVILYPNGKVNELILAKNHKDDMGKVWKAGSKTVLFSDGTTRKITLTENMVNPYRNVFKAGTEAFLYTVYVLAGCEM
jgi:hypothetical protein